MKRAQKKTVQAAVFITLGVLLLLIHSHVADVIAGVFFGVALSALLRPAKTTKKRPTVTLPATQRHSITEFKRPKKPEPAVMEDITGASAQAAPLGIEYQKRQWQETKVVVDETLDMFLTAISGKLSFCTAAIFFHTDGGYTLRRSVSKSGFLNLEARIIPRRGILGSLLAEEGGLRPFYEPSFTNKNATLYYYDEEHEFKPEENIRSIMLCPAETAGETIAIVLVDSTKENAYSKEDLDFLRNIATLIGRSIYYTYLNTDHSLEYQRLAAISSVEDDFWKNLELDAVMDKMRDIIAYAITCDRLTISLKEEDTMTASIVRVHGEGSAGFDKLTFQLDGDSPKTIATVAYSQVAFSRNFNDDRHEPRYAENEPKSKGFGSFLAVPFGSNKLSADKFKGLMLVESVKKDAFTNFSAELLSRLGTSAGLALEKIFIIQKEQALARYDALTGIYNRRQFEKILNNKITSCKRYGDPLSLVLCDIDHFKKLNDTYGHPFGDIVLKGVAAKLESCVRIDIDAAARYGGEEFVLILDKTDCKKAKDLVERIRQTIEKLTFRTNDGKDVTLTMSFGIAEYSRRTLNNDDLVEWADQALYKAKANGRNRVEIYQ